MEVYVRIGIIGTGISGNLAARLLSQEHDIEVFESSPTIGGHTRTLDVNAFGQTWQVDTGFMVFNDWTYRNFCRLLHLLGLSGIDTDMSFSVRWDQRELEYAGTGLNGLFAQRQNLARPSFWRFLADWWRFNRDGRRVLEALVGNHLRRARRVVGGDDLDAGDDREEHRDLHVNLELAFVVVAVVENRGGVGGCAHVRGIPGGRRR